MGQPTNQNQSLATSDNRNCGPIEKTTETLSSLSANLVAGLSGSLSAGASSSSHSRTTTTTTTAGSSSSNSRQEDADRKYEERIEEEYAKREGGA